MAIQRSRVPRPSGGVGVTVDSGTLALCNLRLSVSYFTIGDMDLSALSLIS